MDHEEMLKQVSGAAETAATNATVKALAPVSQKAEENSKALAGIDESVKALTETVKMQGEKLEKMAKSQMAVSMKDDLGMGQKDINAVSKVKALKGIMTGNWSGAELEKEMFDATHKKAIEGGAAISGGYLMPTELSSDIIGRIVSRNVLQNLGARFVNPTRFNFEVPKVTGGASAYWVGENAAIPESGMTFGLLRMAPKLLAALTYASRTSVDAGDPGIISIIESDIEKALMAKMMSTALYGDGTNNTPLGLFASPGVQTLDVAAAGDIPTFAHMLAMINKIDDSDLDGARFGFLSRAKVFNKLKSQVIQQYSGDTAGAPVVPPIISDAKLAEMLGVPFQKTSAVLGNKAKGSGTGLSDLVYGDWSEFIVATWGGLMIERSTEGGTAFQNHQYAIKATMEVDFGARRPEAFVRSAFAVGL